MQTCPCNGKTPTCPECNDFGGHEPTQDHIVLQPKPDTHLRLIAFKKSAFEDLCLLERLPRNARNKITQHGLNKSLNEKIKDYKRQIRLLDDEIVEAEIFTHLAFIDKPILTPEAIAIRKLQLSKLPDEKDSFTEVHMQCLDREYTQVAA